MSKYQRNIRPLFPAHHEMFNEFQALFQAEIEWVKERNVSTAPYHDTQHLIGVAYLLWYLCLNDPEYAEHKAELIIAGLLHDFNYRRDHDDMVNIVETCRDIEPFFEKFPQYNQELVMRIITFTYFSFDGEKNPFIAEFNQYGLLESAIREADSLYGTFFFDTILFEGLYEEIGKRFQQTYQHFITRNIRFVASTQFTRRSFKQLHDYVVETCIAMHCELYHHSRSKK